APPVPKAPPAPHYPSFAPPHRGPVVLWLLACLAGVVIIAATALLGWWFVPFLAGLASGLAARYGLWRLRVTLPATVAVAAAGWGAAPWWLVRGGPPEGTGARGGATVAGPPAPAPGRPAATRTGRRRGRAARGRHPGGRRPMARPCPGPRPLTRLSRPLTRPGRPLTPLGRPLTRAATRTFRDHELGAHLTT